MFAPTQHPILVDNKSFLTKKNCLEDENGSHKRKRNKSLLGFKKSKFLTGLGLLHTISLFERIFAFSHHLLISYLGSKMMGKCEKSQKIKGKLENLCIIGLNYNKCKSN